MNCWIRCAEKPINLAEPSSFLDREFEIATLVYTEGFPNVVWHKYGGFIIVAENKDADEFGILGVC